MRDKFEYTELVAIIKLITSRFVMNGVCMCFLSVDCT